MSVMTCREFNQKTSLAQKYAETAPVIITHRGKPTFVLLKYEDYQQPNLVKRTIADALADPDPACADIDFPIQPRSKTQRPAVDFGEE